jgi:hypothetical protein
MLTLQLEIRGDMEKLPSPSPLTDGERHDVSIDINSIFIIACERLEETGMVFFKMSGFGRDPWPVEVYPDLACILEQLVEAINAIRQDNYPFDLELYEQGTNKTIIFNKKKDAHTIEVKCRDFVPQRGDHYRGAWRPNPDKELVKKNDILSQLVELKASFIQIVQNAYPDLATEDLFIEWCKS